MSIEHAMTLHTVSEALLREFSDQEWQEWGTLILSSSFEQGRLSLTFRLRRLRWTLSFQGGAWLMRRDDRPLLSRVVPSSQLAQFFQQWNESTRAASSPV